MANVSPNKIEKVSSELKSIINNLNTSCQQLASDYNNYISSINSLNSYNGALAPGSNSEVEKRWSISVSGADNQLNAGTIIDSVSQNIELLDNNNQLLLNASSEIAGYISKIEEVLSNEINLEKGGLYKYLKNVEYNEIHSDGFTAQGYTNVGDLIFITAYDHLGIIDKIKFTKQRNSRMYVYDNITKKYLGILEFDNKDHVGGITYDNTHNVVYITGKNGKVEAYNYKKLKQLLEDGSSNLKYNNNNYFINYDEVDWADVRMESNINIYDLANTTDAATVSYDSNSNSLYVSNYDADGKYVKYSIVKEGDKIVSTPVEVNSIGEAVQGLGFYEDNNKKYMVTSSSAKLTDGSLLTKYKYNQRNNKWIPVSQKFIDHAGAEGLSIDSGGNIVIVNEYGNFTTETIHIDQINETYNKNDSNRLGLATQANAWNVIPGNNTYVDESENF